jgi:hypothetical protein
MKELLIERITTFNITPTMLEESIKNNGGRLIVQGLVQRAEAKNGNGRVYPKDTLEREVQKYKDTYIKENRALGELDHPESPIINLKNVCHNIKDLWWDKDDVIGKIEVLPTPSGNILKALLIAGITIGISSRGMGSVKQIGETVEVQPDFELLCWDFVSTPSTQGAFMEIVSESKQYQQYNKEQQKKLDKINELVTEILCNRAGFCTCELPEITK